MRPSAKNPGFVEPLVAIRNAGDDEKDGHSDSQRTGPDRALEARSADGRSSTDRSADNIDSLRATVLVSPEFVVQRFPLDGPRAISWKGGDVDEEFCPTVGWRDEPEATIGIPRPQDASELHVWGLMFEMRRRLKRAKRALGCRLDGVARHRRTPHLRGELPRSHFVSEP